jgi:hypothetical protein
VTATERPPKERAADLLAAMSFEEKIALAVHDFDAVAHSASRRCGTPTVPTASAARTT